MNLSDLLLSYNQIEIPEQSPIIQIEPSPTRYSRMLDYISDKQDAPKKETPVQEKELETPEEPVKQSTINSKPTNFSYTPNSKSNTIVIDSNPNKKAFNSAYDEVIKKDSGAVNYRKFLTQVAERESGFRQKVQNKAGAPAWGYFQFMQSEDGKYNNIKHYANTDIQSFLDNPQLQIESAIKLVKDFEKSITRHDKLKAKMKGLDLDSEKGKNAALHAMWLAGPGGFRKWLNGENPSDKKWSKNNQGTSVDELIKKYNV